MMMWKSAKVTFTGDREINEDFCVIKDFLDVMVAIVADGLGGHHFGEWASRYFCEGIIFSAPTFVSELPHAGKNQRIALCQQWVNMAIQHLRSEVRTRDNNANPMTTCAMAILLPDAVISIHIGDSRIYRITTENILWRTRDHSVTQALYEAGEISEEEMGTHPSQNKLLKAIDLHSNVEATIESLPALLPGESLLLCTDGFWERLTQTELIHLCNSPSIQQAIEYNAELAIARAHGTADNTTALVVAPIDRSKSLMQWKPMQRKYFFLMALLSLAVFAMGYYIWRP